MKKFRKIACIATGAVLALVMGISVPVYGRNETVTSQVYYKNIKVNINGTQTTLTDLEGRAQEPVILNDTVYVPLSAAVRALGGTSAWDQALATVNITTSSSGAASNADFTGRNETVTSQVYYRDIKVNIDGTQTTLTDLEGRAQEPVILNDTVYVPLSAAVRALGGTSAWDQASATINITTSASSGGYASASNQSPATDNSVIGTWTDNTYVNNLSGIKFTMPENWVKLSENQISSVINIGLKYVNEYGSGIPEEMVSEQVFSDMVCYNTDNYDNVSIAFEDMSKIEGASDMTADEYAEISLLQLDILDMDYETGEIENAAIAGKNFKTFTVSVNSLPKIKITQHYYVRKVGNYMMSICITLTGGDAAEILKCFTAV
ncbi:MAG: copper amine oxidase N-terminal domain-containing protein [Clostridiales bacterium]|nr:copper amine oxidase N-terminal domain-containing protein [Clostridiales bacterium]